MPVNRNLPAGIPSYISNRTPHAKKLSRSNVTRFIAREEELHQARQYAQSHDINASRALWEEKQNRQTGSGARMQHNAKLDEERDLLNKEVLAIRRARLQKYYDICYREYARASRHIHYGSKSFALAGWRSYVTGIDVEYGSNDIKIDARVKAF